MSSSHARGAHDLQRFGRDLGADAVPADDPDPMGHWLLPFRSGSGHEKTAHAGVDGWSERRCGVRLSNDDDREVHGHEAYQDRSRSQRCQTTYGPRDRRT